MQVYSVSVEIFDGINRQFNQMQAPRLVIQNDFLSLVQQAANTLSPIRIIMSRSVPIWDNFENRQRTIENKIVFKNNAFLSAYANYPDE